MQLTIIDKGPSTLAEIQAAHRARRFRLETVASAEEDMAAFIWVFGVHKLVTHLIFDAEHSRLVASSKRALLSETAIKGKWSVSVRVMRILDTIYRRTRISPAAMKGEVRNRETCAARHEAMYELRHKLNLSLPRIGRIMGDRDHTTVQNGIRKHCIRNKLDLPAGMMLPNTGRFAWIGK